MEHRFTLTNIPYSQTIDVKFQDLSYAVWTGYRRPKKQILKGLSGFFRSTELTAIMGPSGAGKSTLLNILSGFQKDLCAGTVEYLNGGNKQNRSSCKKQLCYVQQANNLHDFFTVHEIMMIASYLKINQSISYKSRQMLIDDILETLKLLQSKETRVDRLSGGQKKRLNIALELIDNPPLMFLDEPTTGLDSLASFQCVTALKTLAQTGRTIICTIHQPSAALYQMFDYIYLVVDGHCMYRSPPGDTVDYFARRGLQCPKYHNPADYMLEVVSKEYGNYDEQLIAAARSLAELNDETRSIRSSHNMIQQIPDTNQTMVLTSPPTELVRFWVLLQRCIILAHRDRTTVYVKLVLHLVVAVIIGLLYEHTGDEGSKTIENITYLFNSMAFFSYVSLMSAVIKFPLEIDILRKEHFNNWYQLKTYYMAILVYTIPLQVTLTFVHLLISYVMSSQPPEFSRFFMFLLTIILSNFAIEGLGLGLGAIFKPLNGIFIGSVVICTMLCLAGIFPRLKHMTNFMYYLTYLNLLRYTLNGVIQSIYGNHREKLHCSTIYCHFRIPNIILEEQDLTKRSFWLDIAILFGHFITFWVLTYMLLKKRLSRMY